MPIKNYSATAGLTFQEIANEFGGVVPHSSSEYYAGGAYVTQGAVGYPSGGGAVAIPSSGTVSFNNYFGSQRSLILDVLIVGGGAGAARGGGDNDVGNGGGGAGGYISITGWGPIYAGTSWYANIGAGGAAGFFTGGSGSNTTFAGYTAYGGGGGGPSDWGTGVSGGSGGGNAGRVTWRAESYGVLLGVSTQGVGSYGAAWPSGSGLVQYFGYDGGLGTGWGTAGGGGGAGGAGGSPDGGAGRQWLDGNYYAGGGGGNTNGTGGSGIGGAGQTWLPYCAAGPYGYVNDGYGNLVYQPLYYGIKGGDGVANTGSGGGAGSSGRCNGPAGAGGSGVVIVRYLGNTVRASGGTIYTSGGYVYHKFTSSGTWSF